MRHKFIVGVVIALHVVVILLMIFLPAWLNRMKPVKTPPDAMMVSLVAPAPSVPDVAPVKTVQPPPTPEPVPEKVTPPPKPKKKKIEISKKRIVRDTPKPKKRVSAEDIKKQLQLKKSSSIPTSTTKAPLPAWYYTSVRDILYSAWSQPASLSAASGHQVKVQLTVRRDGRISTKNIIRRSGQAEMDQSVKAALAAVSKLNALPAQYAGATVDITITFELNQG